jgi:drug/metabolite transporter (DMT)-like permease
VLLRETLTWSIIVGMFVILGGIVLANLRKAASPQPAVERDSAAA